MHGTRSLLFTVVVILAVVALGGCARRTATVDRSTGSATIGSRDVKFSVDGDGGIMGLQDSAAVTFAVGKVIVEKDRILFYDIEVAKMPADAKVVDVGYTSSTLTIRVDGAKVHESKFGLK